MTNDPTSQSFAAVILAGGRSSRMNFPKAWLPYNKDQSFLERIVDIYHQSGISKVIVVLNHHFIKSPWKRYVQRIEEKASIVVNRNPESGRLYSLKLGLDNLDSSFVFVHNVDNPFIDENLIIELKDRVITEGSTVPVFNKKGGHPVVIDTPIQEEIRHNYQSHPHLKGLLANYPTKRVDILDERILINLNTPQDYKNRAGELV